MSEKKPYAIVFPDGKEGINPDSYELFHDELSIHDDLSILDNLESQDGRYYISEQHFANV